MQAAASSASTTRTKTSTTSITATTTTTTSLKSPGKPKVVNPGPLQPTITTAIDPSGEIEEISKKISEHAEAIYRTWKSRGVAPTELLEFYTSTIGVPDSPLPVGLTANDFLAATKKMMNDTTASTTEGLQQLVSSFVSKDKEQRGVKTKGTATAIATPSTTTSTNPRKASSQLSGKTASALTKNSLAHGEGMSSSTAVNSTTKVIKASSLSSNIAVVKSTPKSMQHPSMQSQQKPTAPAAAASLTSKASTGAILLKDSREVVNNGERIGGMKSSPRSQSAGSVVKNMKSTDAQPMGKLVKSVDSHGSGIGGGVASTTPATATKTTKIAQSKSATSVQSPPAIDINLNLDLGIDLGLNLDVTRLSQMQNQNLMKIKELLHAENATTAKVSRLAKSKMQSSKAVVEGVPAEPPPSPIETIKTAPVENHAVAGEKVRKTVQSSPVTKSSLSSSSTSLSSVSNSISKSNAVATPVAGATASGSGTKKLAKATSRASNGVDAIDGVDKNSCSGAIGSGSGSGSVSRKNDDASSGGGSKRSTINTTTAGSTTKFSAIKTSKTNAAESQQLTATAAAPMLTPTSTPTTTSPSIAPSDGDKIARTTKSNSNSNSNSMKVIKSSSTTSRKESDNCMNGIDRPKSNNSSNGSASGDQESIKNVIINQKIATHTTPTSTPTPTPSPIAAKEKPTDKKDTKVNSSATPTTPSQPQPSSLLSSSSSSAGEQVMEIGRGSIMPTHAKTYKSGRSMLNGPDSKNLGRPILTRGSVAERVLMFEKCPDARNSFLNIKRPDPADAPPKSLTKVKLHATPPPPPPERNALQNEMRSTRYIPRFYFPHGKPQPQIAQERTLRNVLGAFDSFPNNQVTKDELPRILKICGLPFYWRMPVMVFCQQGNSGLVERQRFVEFWKQMNVYCHENASRFVYILSRGQRFRQYILPEDMAPMVQDVVDTHPGLAFLKEATEFHSRYVHTVIARIFYAVNRSWSGKITISELKKSDLLEIISLLEEEDDINQIMAFFSYEHFYVIYCKFWELDKDHDLLINQEDLSRHSDHALSTRIIERIFSGCVTRSDNKKQPDDEPKMSYTDFVWFLLSEEDKRTPTAIEYWFRCMDIDGDGVLSMYELEYFYEEQQSRMESIGIETLPFEDCLCQMLDMIKPQRRDCITLGDLKRCKMTHVFFDTFFNLEKYLDHEQRDPFASQRDEFTSDWDRFAAQEYELLITEENE